MKGFKSIFIVSITLIWAAFASAQTNLLDFQPKQLKFPERSYGFVISSTTPSLMGVSCKSPKETQSISVLKSPVCYTAFFCKMEVKTAKAFGIMIKVHAGDYDAYTGGYRNPRP